MMIKWHTQEQRNSQRGVGTACQSRGGSHSQGCHWRKRLESCVERVERDKGVGGGGGRVGGGMEDEEDTSRETGDGGTGVEGR